MSDIVKKYELKSGNILSMIRDNDAESPDNWDNEDVFLVYDHRQFTIKRDGFEPKEIFHYIETKRRIKELYSLKNNTDDELELLEEYEEELNSKYNDYYIFLVAAYIHSGISLSLTDSFERKGFDTSVTGFILVKEETAEGLELDITIKDKYKESEDKARYLAEGLIETWNQYLSGDVYGFKIERSHTTFTITKNQLDDIVIGTDIDLNHFIEAASVDEDYEEIDACWGFYGDDIQTNGILDHINDEIIKEIEL